MPIIRNIYSIFLDALFPISSTERELFTYSKEQAYEKLPEAPTPPMPDMYSIFAYKDERVTKLIWNIKYKRSEKAISIGGYALYRELLKSPGDPISVMPIPISNRRRKERGFNQCELLIDEIRRLDRALKFHVIDDILERNQHISRQTFKHRRERLLNTHNIFSLNEKVLEKLKMKDREFMNRKTVIIDDVITTGSTMNEAILTLRNAGFENVWGLSLAH
jgi:ComF family protein